MKATKRTVILAALLAAGAWAPAAAEAQVIEGQVVRVTQQTVNEGELDVLTIRTQQGETMRLLLGRAGSSAGRVQEGDRIRARLSNAQPAGESYRVRSMKVQRTGERLQYRTAAGDMLRTRSRDRIHEPGSAGCPSGTGRGSRGRTQRGGGGR